MKIGKIVLAAVFFAAALILQCIMEAYYSIHNGIEHKETKYSYGTQGSVSGAGGTSPAWLITFYGDEYEISQIDYKYSALPIGYIVSIKASEQETECGKIPLQVTLSLGNEAVAEKNLNFKNLSDPNELFASDRENPLPTNVISYNEFYATAARKCRVIFYEGDDEENIPYMVISDESQNETISCCYGMNNGTGYSFDGHFALSLEDYNGDGKPDFIYKAAEPQKKGCTYRIHYTDVSLGGKSGDPAIYIYGETSDSPRLDSINSDNFFYLTRDEYGYVTPCTLRSDGTSGDIGDYENNGWVFTSYYEDGVTTLKGTVISAKALYNNNNRVKIAVKKLDGLVWRSINLPAFNTLLSVDYEFESDTATIAKELEQGLYKIEVTVNGKRTETEFTVRS